jgi:hypothetical protein
VRAWPLFGNQLVAVGWAPPNIISMPYHAVGGAHPVCSGGLQTNFASPLGGFLPPPRGEIPIISPHCHIPTADQQRACAGKVRRNSPNFAPREKEKNFGGAKLIRAPPKPKHAWKRKSVWGSFAILWQAPVETVFVFLSASSPRRIFDRGGRGRV